MHFDLTADQRDQLVVGLSVNASLEQFGDTFRVMARGNPENAVATIEAQAAAINLLAELLGRRSGQTSGEVILEIVNALVATQPKDIN